MGGPVSAGFTGLDEGVLGVWIKKNSTLLFHVHLFLPEGPIFCPLLAYLSAGNCWRGSCSFNLP